MRDEPTGFDAWLRNDLRHRFGMDLRQPLPAEMLALLDAVADER